MTDYSIFFYHTEQPAIFHCIECKTFATVIRFISIEQVQPAKDSFSFRLPFITTPDLFVSLYHLKLYLSMHFYKILLVFVFYDILY